MKNPWQNVNFGQTVASVDIPIISSMKQKQILQLEILPEPFHGDPEANVYLLNGNPGFCNQDLNFINNHIMQKEFSDIYSHRRTDFLWLEKIPSILDSSGIPHPAYDWWRKRLTKVIMDVEAEPRLFCVELFPYHSFKSFSYPALPSNEYADSLICNAMKRNALIIVMRGAKGWYERIPLLSRYSNRICLNTPRCTYITPNNLSKSGMKWCDVISYFNI